MRKLFRRLRLRGAGIHTDVDIPKLLIGRSDRRSSPMAVYPEPLNASSVVYSFGVGQEITWDQEMIDRFGMTIHGFDPSPGSMHWINSIELPPEFTFHPIGIGDRDGTMTLYPPRRATSVHFSVINRAGADEVDAVEVPVKTLASIADMLGHDHIDVLKLDVEGAEYALMPTVLAAGIPIHQITLEVHHNFPTKKFADTFHLIRQVREAGFRIFDVSERGRELSFVHASLL
ncbi:MAG: FkbM family methyltransferase [Phycisphaerales bacterium]|nr:FkbM family methyltransferase [Phycisphaerales bacterium]